jgi:hypothetical protein
MNLDELLRLVVSVLERLDSPYFITVGMKGKLTFSSLW